MTAPNDPTLTCAQALDLVPAAAERELRAADARALIAHIAACDDARCAGHELEQAIAVRQQLRADVLASYPALTQPLPASFWAGFCAVRPAARPSLPAGFWDGYTDEVIDTVAPAEDSSPVLAATARPALPGGFWDDFTDGVLARVADEVADESADTARERALRSARPPLPDGFWDGFTAEVTARAASHASTPAMGPATPAAPAPVHSAHSWRALWRPALAAALLLALLLPLALPSAPVAAPVESAGAPELVAPARDDAPTRIAPYRVRRVRAFALDNSVPFGAQPEGARARVRRASQDSVMDVAAPASEARARRLVYPIDRAELGPTRGRRNYGF